MHGNDDAFAAGKKGLEYSKTTEEQKYLPLIAKNDRSSHCSCHLYFQCAIMNLEIWKLNGRVERRELLVSSFQGYDDYTFTWVESITDRGNFK